MIRVEEVCGMQHTGLPNGYLEIHPELYFQLSSTAFLKLSINSRVFKCNGLLETFLHNLQSSNTLVDTYLLQVAFNMRHMVGKKRLMQHVVPGYGYSSREFCRSIF